MIKRKKTQLEMDLRARFLVGLWAGAFAGIITGVIIGAVVTYHNIGVSDTQEIKAEIRITVDKMELERIEMNNLSQMIRGWQMEIDEVWLYYGTSERMRTRIADSDEGRPSGND